LFVTEFIRGDCEELLVVLERVDELVRDGDRPARH